MPTPTKGPRLGGSSSHQRHILANLATALFEHRRITTTEAKARRLRPVAERLITFAKRGDLHARRRVLTLVTDKSVVHTLFTDIGPELRHQAGWLHPDHQDRPTQGRQRAYGRDRACHGRDAGVRASAPPGPPCGQPGSAHRRRGGRGPAGDRSHRRRADTAEAAADAEDALQAEDTDAEEDGAADTAAVEPDASDEAAEDDAEPEDDEHS